MANHKILLSSCNVNKTIWEYFIGTLLISPLYNVALSKDRFDSAKPTIYLIITPKRVFFYHARVTANNINTGRPLFSSLHLFPKLSAFECLHSLHQLLLTGGMGGIGTCHSIMTFPFRLLKLPLTTDHQMEDEMQNLPLACKEALSYGKDHFNQAYNGINYAMKLQYLS